MLSVTLKKWGNSQGVLFPKSLLDQLDLSVGDELNLTLENGRLIIEPVRMVRGRFRLEELLNEVPDDNKPQEVSWGEPRGKEVW